MIIYISRENSLNEYLKRNHLEIIRNGKSTRSALIHKVRQITFIELNDFQQLKDNDNLIFIRDSIILKNPEQLEILEKKLKLSESDLAWVSVNHVVAVGLKKIHQSSLSKVEKAIFNSELEQLELNCLQAPDFYDLSRFDDLVGYLHSDFQLRHFNNLRESDYQLTKSSIQKEKIKAEYNYFHFAPDILKPSLIPTFDYEELGDVARYSMPKKKILDFSLQWINNSVSEESFAAFVARLDYYFSILPKKLMSADKRSQLFDSLYISKVEKRLELLKKSESFKQLQAIFSQTTDYAGIDELFGRYFSVIRQMKKNIISKFDYSAVSHGDLCFSNILFSEGTKEFFLLDPKGAISADAIYSEPTYDLVKLSHSINGNYDFIVNNLQRIEFDRELNIDLKVSLPEHYRGLKDQFNEWIFKTFSLEVRELRVMEVSLFLSMIPLHLDSKKKALSFLINASQILDEI